MALKWLLKWLSVCWPSEECLQLDDMEPCVWYACIAWNNRVETKKSVSTWYKFYGDVENRTSESTSKRAESESNVHTVDTCTPFDQSHSHGHASRVGRAYIEHHGGRLVYREYNHAVRETRRETKAVARVTLIDSPTSSAAISFAPFRFALLLLFHLFSLRLFLATIPSLTLSLFGQLLSLSSVFYLSPSLSLRMHDIHFPLDASTTVLRDSVDFETVHRERGISLVYNRFSTDSSPFPFASETLST